MSPNAPSTFAEFLAKTSLTLSPWSSIAGQLEVRRDFRSRIVAQISEVLEEKICVQINFPDIECVETFPNLADIEVVRCAVDYILRAKGFTLMEDPTAFRAFIDEIWKNAGPWKVLSTGTSHFRQTPFGEGGLMGIHPCNEQSGPRRTGPREWAALQKYPQGGEVGIAGIHSLKRSYFDLPKGSYPSPKQIMQRLDGILRSDGYTLWDR